MSHALVKLQEKHVNGMLERLGQGNTIKTRFICDISLVMVLEGHLLFYTEL